MIINSQVTSISGGGDSSITITIKFTDLRAGLPSGKFCTGYKDKNGNDVTFPYTGTIGDINKFTPVITNDTSKLKTSTYLEIGAGVSITSYNALSSTQLQALVLHDISGVISLLCEGCTNLSDVVIEDCTFTAMISVFKDCTSLVNAPAIPSTVTNMSSTFRGCTSLVNPPVIPSGVTNMGYTFYGCTSLVNPPVLPNGVTSMSYMFYNCSSLIDTPVIPSSVTNISRAFYGCTSLVNAKNIPSSATNVSITFSGCTKLETCKFAHTTVPSYSATLSGCSSLIAIYVPSSALSTWKAATGWSSFASKMVGY